MNLTEFLLARISEDETKARAAALTVGWDGFGEQRVRSGQHWTPSYHVVKRRRDDGPTDRREVADCGALFGISVANHVARWDPARVLADCESKRRIVELHAVEVRQEWVNPPDGPAFYEEDRYCAICHWVPDACDTVKALALPYASHPDYDPSWAA